MDFGYLLTVIPNLFMVSFDTRKNLIYSNTEMAEIFSNFFTTSDYLDLVYTYAQDASEPYIISNYMGLIWEVVLEKKDDILQKVHVLGPIFYTPFSEDNMERILRSYEEHGLNMKNKHGLLKQMQDLPVMSYTQFAHYAMMLHLACNHKKVALEDFRSLGDRLPEVPSDPSDPAFIHAYPNESSADDTVYDRVFESENYFLKEVASGNASCLGEDIKNATKKGSLILMPTMCAYIDEPIRMRKDTLLIFNALECRTAIDAGLLPSTAYRMQDHFIESIERLHSPLGLNDLQKEIHTAYCNLVAKVKNDAGHYSLPIRRCMTFLSGHPTETFSSEKLADLSGYTPYYLSRRFKQEVGMTPKEYFRKVKIDYAAYLLSATNDNISDISEALHYCSHTHFSEDFKMIMGCTPTEYRRRNEKHDV